MPGIWDNDSSTDSSTPQDAQSSGGIWGGPATPDRSGQEQRVLELNQATPEGQQRALHPGSVTPTTWWDRLLELGAKPASGKALSNVNRIFNFLDAPLTA